jgi:hypothetical protein
VCLPDAFTAMHRAPIILAAARNNVPAVYRQSFFARDGGLLSYGPDQVDPWRSASRYPHRFCCALPRWSNNCWLCRFGTARTLPRSLANGSYSQKKRTLAILAAPHGMAGTAPGAAAGPFYRAVRAPVHGPNGDVADTLDAQGESRTNGVLRHDCG